MNKGQGIENESFEIIKAKLKHKHPDIHLPIVLRVIHATGDFEFEDLLRFHPEAVKKGMEAIKNGKKVLVDVKMVEVGINKKILRNYGSETLCFISDPEVADIASTNGLTRAEVAMEKAVREYGNQIGVVAIGNAPTALLKIIELIEAGAFQPYMVIGVPVGFVSAAESKEMLLSKDYPYITCLGTKGGSPVAASIVNAIIRTLS